MARRTVPRRLGKREQTKICNRAVMLASARQVFAERGFDGASVRDVVRASGLSVGTFYEYFRNKEEVFAAVAAEVGASLRQRLRAVRRDRSVCFEDRVYRAYLVYFEHLTEDHALSAVLARDLWQLGSAGDPGVALAIQELREDLLPDLGEAVDGMDPDLLAAAMVGCGLLVARRMLSRSDRSPAEAARLCTRFALHGVTQASTSRRRTG